jgi:large subunit ribosomal protein L11e
LVSSEFGITRRSPFRSRSVGARPEEILERLKLKEYEVCGRDFSETANFGSGMQELIGARFDLTIQVGIFGMDFYAVMDRPGAWVARWKMKRVRIRSNHQ